MVYGTNAVWSIDFGPKLFIHRVSQSTSDIAHRSIIFNIIICISLECNVGFLALLGSRRANRAIKRPLTTRSANILPIWWQTSKHFVNTVLAPSFTCWIPWYVWWFTYCGLCIQTVLIGITIYVSIASVIKGSNILRKHRSIICQRGSRTNW